MKVSLSDDALHPREMIRLALESESGMIIASGKNLLQHDRVTRPEEDTLNRPPMTIPWFAQDREVAVWVL